MIKSLEELNFHKTQFGEEYSENGIEIFFYCGTLSSIEIDGVEIENILDIPPARFSDDELGYRITKTQLQWVIDEINKRGNPNGEYLADTADGEPVFLQPETKEHLAAHSSISIETIKAAVQSISIYGTSFYMKTVNTEFTGETSLVERKPGDKVEMLYRKGRTGKSPVILNAPRELTNRVTIGICKENDSYYLYNTPTGYMGYVDGEYKLFASEADYLDYISDKGEN